MPIWTLIWLIGTLWIFTLLQLAVYTVDLITKTEPGSCLLKFPWCQGILEWFSLTKLFNDNTCKCNYFWENRSLFSVKVIMLLSNNSDALQEYGHYPRSLHHPYIILHWRHLLIQHSIEMQQNNCTYPTLLMKVKRRMSFLASGTEWLSFHASVIFFQMLNQQILLV